MPPQFVEDTFALRPCNSWTLLYHEAKNTGWGKDLQVGQQLKFSIGERVVAYATRQANSYHVVTGYGVVDVPIYRRNVGNNGGWKESMLCPVCLRRCEVIFLVRPGPRCRRCGKLAYKAQYDRGERGLREMMRTLGGRRAVDLELNWNEPGIPARYRRKHVRQGQVGADATGSNKRP